MKNGEKLRAGGRERVKEREKQERDENGNEAFIPERRRFKMAGCTQSPASRRNLQFIKN